MLELARKLEPGIGERFMLFVRDREQKQRQGAGGSDGSYDLLSYVEFQARGGVGRGKRRAPCSTSSGGMPVQQCKRTCGPVFFLLCLRAALPATAPPAAALGTRPACRTATARSWTPTPAPSRPSATFGASWSAATSSLGVRQC